MCDYEPEVVAVMERFVKPGDVVIDAGASIGNHTRRLADLVGDTGLVLAFEPHRESFDILVGCVGKLINVRCMRQALWSHAATLTIWPTADLGLASVHKYDDCVASELVEAVALDRFFDSGSEGTRINRPSFIKVDVEGAEEEVLAGAVQTLTQGVDAVIVELNFHIMKLMGRSDHTIRDYMHALGYDCFIIGSFEPVRVLPAVELQLRGGHMINVLFSTEDKVRQRWPVSKERGRHQHWRRPLRPRSP